MCHFKGPSTPGICVFSFPSLLDTLYHVQIVPETCDLPRMATESCNLKVCILNYEISFYFVMGKLEYAFLK